MKLRLTISFLLFTFFLVSSGSLYAQLLEDTDRKLKTAKTKRRFTLFKKKQKKASPLFLSFGRTNKGKTITPSASGIPFSGRISNPSPRTASGSPFRNARPVAAPRLSVGSPFNKKYKTKPRFSLGLPFTTKDRPLAARFSGPSPFAGQRNKIQPRFSAGLPFTRKDNPKGVQFSGPKPFTRKDFPVPPRFSAGLPFTRKDYPKKPQFSGPKPFTRKDYPVAPRFSAGLPFTRKDYPDRAQFSGPKPFTRKDYPVAPRFSEGSPFVGVKWKVKPRDSRYMSFNLRVMRMMQSIFPNRYVSSFLTNVRMFKGPDPSSLSVQLSRYMGPYKLKPIKPGKNLHPSYRYKKSVLVASESVRNSMRKWNIFWTGFSMNSETSKGVKKKVSKPKFDRKEREIWNN